MKKIRKCLVSISILSLSAVLVFQVAAIKTNSQIVPDITQPVIYQVKASANAAEKEVFVEVATQAADENETVPDNVVAAIPIIANSPDVNNNFNPKDLTLQSAVQNTAATVNIEPKQIIPAIIYDEENQLLYGPDGRGLLYIGFDYDLNQELFYSAINGWQKNFGYNKLYDIAAPLTTILFHTRCIYFDYNGLNWMIQLWKGQYGITSGAEVGIYHKSPFMILGHYSCASEENFLMMDLEVYKEGNLYFTRPAMYHWWQTGFYLGDIVSPNDLNIKSTITFKDQEMADAFVEALSTDEALSDIYYTVNGISVSIDW